MYGADWSETNTACVQTVDYRESDSSVQHPRAVVPPRTLENALLCSHKSWQDRSSLLSEIHCRDKSCALSDRSALRYCRGSWGCPAACFQHPTLSGKTESPHHSSRWQKRLADKDSIPMQRRDHRRYTNS